MKIAVCSDLHLEFDLFQADAPIFNNVEGADVLVLSGDICVAKDISNPTPRYRANGSTLRDFFKLCSENYKHVVYVMGNHEHYNGDFKYSSGLLFSITCQFENIHFLDNDNVTIDDVLFIGGTMWTDMNKEDPLTLFHMKSMMNDFRCVNNSNRMAVREVPLYGDNSLDPQSITKAREPIGYKKQEYPSRFTPEDAVEEHHKFLAYLKMMLSNSKDKKVVVCTHHTPSLQSCHPRYKHDQLMNGGYHSDLSELIEDQPHIKLWTHGHTHELFDYMIGETRIVCNPRGYAGYEEISKTFKPKVVEI